MTRYRVDNLHTGEYKHLEAESRKAAHEEASAMWTGVPVTVHTQQEFQDTLVWVSHHQQILDWLSAIEGAIGDGNRAEARRCLEAAQLHMASAVDYFGRSGA